MKTILLALTLAVSAANSTSPTVSTAPSPARPSRTQRLEAPDQVPDGLSQSAWSSIRQQYEQHRHALVPVEGGHQARNPGQQWRTSFDQRGFLVRPEGAGWQWGLELKSYGFAGHERTVSGRPQVTTKADRIDYAWDETMQEWFINDRRGLEHGFTLKTRPLGAPAPDSQPSPLTLLMAVRGGLRPEVETDKRGVRFVDAQGVAAVTYAGLTVLDADGSRLTARFESVPESLDIEERGAHAACMSASAGRPMALVRLVIDDLDACYPLTIDPIAQIAYLKASNTGAGDLFSYNAVAVSGDTVVIGAESEASSATGVNGNQSDNSAQYAGAAYVFVRSGTTWSQQAYLKASNTETNDSFGFSVAVSGDTVVVGAVLEASSATGVNGNQSSNITQGSGAAYVFVRSGTNWNQQAYLKASNTGSNDYFGWSVAASGNTVVIGAEREDGSATGVNGNQSDNGAPDSGAAYVFVRSGTNWSQQAYLKASNTEAGDSFGGVVSVSGDVMVVGAYKESSSATGVNGNQSDNGAPNAGAAYVFVRDGTNWSQQAYLKASNAGTNDYFGWSVAVSGNTVVVGAFGESSSATGVNGNQSDNSARDSGAAYVFVRSGTNWSQQAYLKASNTEAGDGFGGVVSVSGETVVVGADREDSSADGVNGNQNNNNIQDSGAAYVFVRSGTHWSQRAYLKASNTGTNDFFGYSVALSGDRVVIGAYGEASSATGVNGNQNDNSAQYYAGAAYIFNLNALAITAHPTNQLVFTGSNAVFTVAATTLNPPLSYQWQFNAVNIVAATNNSLTISNVQLANLGNYNVLVSDASDTVSSASARLNLMEPYLTRQPANLAVKISSNATFSVSASGAPPLFYQWQFSGVNLANQTNATLLVTNVQAAQLGDYTAVISNKYGSTTSAIATLTFLTPPTIVEQPQPVTVFAGENATFTVTVTNTATIPVNYQWRKGSSILTNILLNTTNCSFTLYNVQTNVTTTNGPGAYRVVVTNAASIGQGFASSLIALAVVTAVPPVAVTLAATDIASGGATLTGSVDPKGATTRARFEYGLTTSYESSTLGVNLGNGTNVVKLSLALAGLRPKTTYHYRLAASNSGGTNYGVDVVFTTSQAPVTPPLLVAPVWQGNQFSVSLVTVIGVTYYLERNSNLTDSNWTPVVSQPGNGLVQALIDPSVTDGQGYYRVRAE